MSLLINLYGALCSRSIGQDRSDADIFFHAEKRVPSPNAGRSTLRRQTWEYADVCGFSGAARIGYTHHQFLDFSQECARFYPTSQRGSIDVVFGQNGEIARAQIEDRFRPAGNAFGTLTAPKGVISARPSKFPDITLKSQKVRRVPVHGPLMQIAGGAALNYFSRTHEHHPITGRERFLRFVGHNYCRCPKLSQQSDCFASHGGAQAPVEIGKGSSISKRCGLGASARASATRCCSPPESICG